MPTEVSLREGDVFAGDFRVLSRLGGGGMGQVYRVEQRSTGRQRALKVLDPSVVSSPELLARFELEARVGARIGSARVVDVLDARVDPASSAPYLVMELLEGETLAARLRRAGSLPPSEVLALFAQLVDALGKAHAAGVVHRDLKPENVFLAAPAPGEELSVKLLDFGIAKLVEGAGPTRTEAVGTPLFMAPEQLSGGRVSPATDVWALGILAFLLLTGRPYWRSLLEGATPLRLLHEIVYEPLAPAQARARELGSAAELPEGFDAWFARCTDREPSRRPQDATEALALLRPALLGPPAASSSPFAAPAPPPFLASSSPFAALPAEIATRPSPFEDANPFAASAPLAVSPPAALSASGGLARGSPGARLLPVFLTGSLLAFGVVGGVLTVRARRAPDPASLPAVSAPAQATKAELYGKACDAGDGAGCNNLARLLAHGTGVPVDLPRALALNERACALELAAGCSDAGYAYELGRGAPVDLTRASTFYRLGCDRGNLGGCSNLGTLYEGGKGVARDDAMAVRLYTSACEGGNAAGCGNLGWTKAYSKTLPRDEAGAIPYLRKGCDGGEARACSNLAYALEMGKGTGADLPFAARLYEKACDGGNAGGCTNLGRLYEKGRGVEADRKKAEVFFRRGCDGGHAAGCTSLANLLPNSPAPAGSP